MLSEILNQSMVYTSDYPSNVSDYVNKYLGKHRLVLTEKEKLGSSLSYKEFSKIGLSKISYGNNARVVCDGLVDIYHFQMILRGSCSWQTKDQNLTMQRGQALVLNPEQPHEMVYSPDCEKVIVKVPREILHASCLSYAGNIPRAGVIFDPRVIDLKKSLAFICLFEAVLREAENEDDSLVRIEASYRELLLQKLLASFPNNIKQGCDEETKDEILREALSYIRQHIKDEISVDDLASLCNVSNRTLYNLFSKYMDSTPKQYIKNARLKELQNEIMNNHKIRNVTEVALEYGFTHLGRFSSDYKRLFGELPSETFKRFHN